METSACVRWPILFEYGRGKGWKQIVFGHIGRDPKGSLKKVRDRLAEILKCEVGFVEDWLESGNDNHQGRGEAEDPDCPCGQSDPLENTRKYPVETTLWKTKADGHCEGCPPIG